MTIGIDASRAFRKNKTGTEWYSYHVTRELIRRNTSDRFVLYTDRNIPPEEVGFQLPALATFKHLAWPFPKLWTQGRLSLEMMICPPDVLFVPAHAIPLVHPKKTVTTIHDIGYLQYPESYSKKDLKYLRWSTEYAVKNASSLITVSEFSKHELVACYKIPPEKIHVIHLGYDEDVYHLYSQQEILRIQTHYNLVRPYLICIARLEPRKNISFLIDVFDALKEKGYSGDLVLIGPEGYGARKVFDRIQTSPFMSSIHHLGWVDEKEKAILLAGADCFVFPSLYEGFGLPIIEAQACGVPVVCSNSTSLPEVGGEGALYSDPRSIDDFVRNVRKVLYEETAKESLLLAGKKNIQRFSWQTTAMESLKILQLA